MIVCPRCGKENPPDARFCMHCAAELIYTCRVCGMENPRGAHFCLRCGTLLAQAVSTERRVVSVLFADLVGSTPLTSQLDPERMRAIIGDYFAAMRQEVTRHGGTVEKFIGDAVMAVFGVPAVHEDDPERAVRTAVAMQKQMRPLNAELDADLHIRIGISTGEVVADPSTADAGEFMVTGEVVNLASRLQAQAPVDGIVVDARTYEATKLITQYAPLAAAGAGDFAMHPRWQLVGLLDRPGAKRLRAKLVGRDDEMQFLRALYRRVVDGRKPHLVTVIGPAGVGKTRVVDELVEALGRSPDAPAVLRGRCPAYGEGLTYWPLAEMLKQECEIKDNDSPGTVAEKLRASILQVCEPVLGRVDSELVITELASLLGLKVPSRPAGGLKTLARVVTEDHGLAPGTDEAKDAADPSTSGSSLRRAVRAFFLAKAGTRPLVLIFEDLQWAEESLLELLEYLAIRAADAPILSLCAARPELLERYPQWGGRIRNYIAVSLSPLSTDASRRLVRGLLLGEAIPHEVLDVILERAEGNPFFIEEILRMLVDGASLVQDEGGWHWASSPPEIRIPATIRGLVASRLDLLSPLEKRVIQVASVAGRVFWLRALLATSELNAVEAAAALDRLQDRELIEERAISSLEGEREFTFKHALTREVAYATLPKALRSNSHERFAQWLEVSAAGDTDEFLEVLAYHYEQAWRYRFEAGERAEVLARRAIDTLRRAGARATALRTLPEARRLYDRALAIFRKLELTELTLLLELLTERFEVVKWGDMSASDAALVFEDTQTVIERAPQLGREDLLARAWLNRAHSEYVRLQLQPAEEALQRALDLFRNRHDRQGEAEALEILGMITEDLRGTLRKAQAAFHYALDLYRDMQDGPGMARLTARLGRVLEEMGELAAAHSMLVESIPLARTHHERAFEATGHMGLAIFANLTGDTQEADRQYHEAIAIHQELGSPIVESNIRRRLALMYLRHGKLEDADRELQQAQTLRRQHGAEPESPYVLRALAELHLARGDLFAAAEYAERAVTTAPGFDAVAMATHLATLGKVRAAQGREPDAEALFQRSLSALEAHDYRINLALTWEKYGESLLLLGQRQRAYPALMRARDLFVEMGATAYAQGVEARLLATPS